MAWRLLVTSRRQGHEGLVLMDQTYVSRKDAQALVDLKHRLFGPDPNEDISITEVTDGE